MATREENLKKIHEELEKLTDDELDQIAGGTVSEYKELQDLFGYEKKSLYGPRFVGKKYSVGKSDKWIASWLKDNLNIDAEINTSSWLPWSNGDPNVYKRNGESLTHAQVIAEVKEKLK